LLLAGPITVLWNDEDESYVPPTVNVVRRSICAAGGARRDPPTGDSRRRGRADTVESGAGLVPLHIERG
jgi:hypothetical protein